MDSLGMAIEREFHDFPFPRMGYCLKRAYRPPVRALTVEPFPHHHHHHRLLVQRLPRDHALML